MPQQVESSGDDILAMDIGTYYATMKYLQDLDYPDGCDEVQRRKIRNRARRYTVIDGRLYRKTKQGPKEVLHEREAHNKIRQIHEEAHNGVESTWQRVRRRYAGPGLYQIVRDVISNCDTCQRLHPGPMRQEGLRPIESRYPFEVVGLDAIGPINPTSRNGNRYILTAVDYFTKWPIARATRDIKTETVIEFLLQDVVSMYGVPRKIITDRGSDFTSDLAEAFFAKLGINHAATTAYRPQANGQVERLNQTLKKQLTHLTNGRDDWDEQLWKALLAIRTMTNASTKQTPSKLLYGTEMLTPAIWTTRRTDFVDQEEELEERMRLIQWDLPKLREQAQEQAREAQKRQKIRYDMYVRPRRFKEDEQVLLRVVQPGGKFTNIYEGLYRVARALQNGTYIICDAEGRRDLVHGDRLKNYQARADMIPQVKPSHLHSTLQRYRQP
jgi:hypothetical protein